MPSLFTKRKACEKNVLPEVKFSSENDIFFSEPYFSNICIHPRFCLSGVGPWSAIWQGKGPKGHEVVEDTEDVLLPHLTSENPLAGGDPTGEPAFNAQVYRFSLSYVITYSEKFNFLIYMFIHFSDDSFVP